MQQQTAIIPINTSLIVFFLSKETKNRLPRQTEDGHFVTFFFFLNEFLFFSLIDEFTSAGFLSDQQIVFNISVNIFSVTVGNRNGNLSYKHVSITVDGCDLVESNNV